MGDQEMNARNFAIAILFCMTIPLMLSLISNLPTSFNTTEKGLLFFIPVILLGYVAALVWD
jgi:hypothetical protein